MKALLLINLGTPDSSSVKSVRKYLREFLSDPYVLDINPILRWLLLNFIILRKRPKQSAKLYQNIWTKQGSPLLINSQALAINAQKLLGNEYKVALGMRYGNPSIESAFKALVHCKELTILPLFPQYSLATTESAVQKTLFFAQNIFSIDKIKIIKDFYFASGFINAQTNLIKKYYIEIKPEKIVFSYHGLPERQVKKMCICDTCDFKQICSEINDTNCDCYRAQCYATSRILADKLRLKNNQFMTVFQSRLGRIPWIKPYLDEMLIELAEQGFKNIMIICPSFVCDCLETLEEIGLRATQQWRTLGGEKLTLVPCLNDDASWVRSIIKSKTL